MHWLTEIQWGALDPINDEGFSPAGLKILSGLNDSIGEIVKRRAAYDSSIGKLSDGAPTVRIEAAQKRRDQLVALLQDELKLINQIRAQWFPARVGERQILHEAATQTHDELCGRIRQQMIEIGYPDGIDPRTAAAWLWEQTIKQHPQVAAAREETTKRFNLLHSREDEQALDRRNHELGEQIRSIFQRTLAAA